MSMLGYYPLVLDGGNFSDGEGAQILQFVQIVAGEEGPIVTPFPRLLPPKLPRKGRMRLAVQLINDPEAPVTQFTLGLTVRSPLVSDDGSPVNQPILNCDQASPANLIVPASFTAPNIFTPISLVPQQQLIPAYNYAPTFNGKPIPNYTYMILFTALSAPFLAPIVEIDFSHSIAS